MATMMMRFQASMLRVSTNYTLNTLVTYLPCYAISAIFPSALSNVVVVLLILLFSMLSKEAGP